MAEWTFDSTLNVLGEMQPRSVEEIKNEPMLFSCDAYAALAEGGPITRQFLNFLPKPNGWIIDSRVHMLMADWYPCIPGWHHDDVLRTRSDGQPNYYDLLDRPEIRHVFVVIDAIDQPTHSLTEYITSPVTLEMPFDPLVGQTIYGKWNDDINQMTGLVKSNVESGQVLEFSTSDFHRGVPATTSGWRIFLRASKNSTRKITNERRNQVQVYMPAPEAGW